MVKQKGIDSSLKPLNRTTSKHLRLKVCGVPFKLDKELLAAKSAKVAVLLRKNCYEEIYRFIQEIVPDAEIFEHVARFCYGFEPQICTENAVPLICLSYYLEMTETHSENNLLKKALCFFEQRILPSWNESIKAFCIEGKVLQQALHLGLVDALIDSVTAKAQIDPRLLGEPLNMRSRIVVPRPQSESLETLHLPLYESIVEAVNESLVPAEYVAGSLCRYMEKWVLSNANQEENTSICRRNSRRQIVETVERLLPVGRGLIPCMLLFQMLRSAVDLDASFECRNRFEKRIGKQLHQATVKDLLILFRGYAKDAQNDTECARRILKFFYSNCATSDFSQFTKVAELFEGFLKDVASDVNLKVKAFVLLAEMTITTYSGISRKSDGIYKAINIYLDNHRFLTELEREEIFQVLDCNKLSPEACEHASRNERLPLRVVVQVLFAGQLHLRDVIMKDAQVCDPNLRNEDISREDEATLNCSGEVSRMEMKKVNNKVLELEKECNIIRKEIEKENGHTKGKEKVSIWGELKRKFGCSRSMHDYSYQDERKKKKIC